MFFKYYSDLLTKFFSALDNDYYQSYYDWKKENKIVKGVRYSDAELMASKPIIFQTYPCCYTYTCAQFKLFMVHINCVAQIYNQKYKHKRQVSAIYGGVRVHGGKVHGIFGPGREINSH